MIKNNKNNSIYDNNDDNNSIKKEEEEEEEEEEEYKQEIILSKKKNRTSASKKNIKPISNLISRTYSSPVTIISPSEYNNDTILSKSSSLPYLGNENNKESKGDFYPHTPHETKKRHKKVPLLSLSTLNIRPPPSESPSSPSTPVTPKSPASLSPLTPVTPNSDILNSIRHHIKTTDNKYNNNDSKIYKTPKDMLYIKHKNGILNINKKDFNDVNFCFICDTIFDNLTVDEIMNNNHLKSSIEITGLHLVNGPVYRKIFYCKSCCSIKVEKNTYRNEIDDINNPFKSVIKITSNASSYFS